MAEIQQLPIGADRVASDEEIVVASPFDGHEVGRVPKCGCRSVHLQQAYAGSVDAELPVTTRVARSVVSLPIYPDLADEAVDGVALAIVSLFDHSDDVGVVNL